MHQLNVRLLLWYRKSTGILLAVLTSHFNPVIAIIWCFVQKVICLKTYMKKCISDFESLKWSCLKRTKLYTPKFFFYILATYFFNNCFYDLYLTDLQLELYLYCTIGIEKNTFSIKLNGIKFMPLRSKDLVLLVDNFYYIT